MGRLGGYVAAAFLAYALICLLAFVAQRGLIYFPVRWDEDSARSANPGYEEIRIRTGDGEALHGWLRRKAEAPWTVVIFHGNAGNLSVQDALMTPFVTLDLQVLLFDYRGFGMSTGTPTQAGLLQDGEAVAEHVERELGVPPGRIVYYGKSLGTGVAVLVASRKPPARMILESSFDSLTAVARRHYFYLPVGLLMRDRFDAASVIAEVRCPLLFLHPDRDEIIPLARGRALFDRARRPKLFVSIPGATHNDPPDSFPPLYLEAIRDFLSPRRGDLARAGPG